MLTNLVIDGNYILSRMVFALHKNNLLYGSLRISLDNTISTYKKMYPFKKIFLVSDSKEYSWRKKIYKSYKENRKKDSDIDWEFVHQCYSEFKQDLKNVRVLEDASIEGDDWIAYLIHKANEIGESNIIISNDYDIKQLLKWSVEPHYINIMTNETFNQTKIFFPENYQIFLNKLKSFNNDDIFSLNDNNDFINLLNNFSLKYVVESINPVHSLLLKIISGDKSDNIPSSYSVKKNGRSRGIGDKGAQSILESYVNEFGEISIDDPDLLINIADIICEKKKIGKSSIDGIVENLQLNLSIIDLRLHSFPENILSKINNKYKNV